jgi:hypothetical protein
MWRLTTQKNPHGWPRTRLSATFLWTPSRRLSTLWSEFSDAYAIFDEHGFDNLLCAAKFWEANFALTHKRMETQLLAREISRLMTWDGDTVDAVNDHFLKVGHTRKVFSYMEKLTIDDVFRAVILATLKVSDNLALRASYTALVQPSY